MREQFLPQRAAFSSFSHDPSIIGVRFTGQGCAPLSLNPSCEITPWAFVVKKPSEKPGSEPAPSAEGTDADGPSATPATPSPPLAPSASPALQTGGTEADACVASAAVPASAEDEARESAPAAVPASAEDEAGESESGVAASASMPEASIADDATAASSRDGNQGNRKRQKAEPSSSPGSKWFCIMGCTAPAGTCSNSKPCQVLVDGERMRGPPPDHSRNSWLYPNKK